MGYALICDDKTRGEVKLHLANTYIAYIVSGETKRITGKLSVVWNTKRHPGLVESNTRTQSYSLQNAFVMNSSDV